MNIPIAGGLGGGLSIFGGLSNDVLKDGVGYGAGYIVGNISPQRLSFTEYRFGFWHVPGAGVHIKSGGVCRGGDVAVVCRLGLPQVSPVRHKVEQCYLRIDFKRRDWQYD